MSLTDFIDRLTPEQEEILPAVRDEWLAVGLSTEPADRPRAEHGVALAYRAVGLEPPSLVLWLRSPLEGVVGAAIGDQVRAQVGAQVGAQVWAQVWDQVWAQVRAQVRAQVKAQVWDQVWDQVRAQVKAQVWDQVEDQVRDQVEAQVEAQVEDQVWDQVRAQVGAQVGAQVRAQVGAQVEAQVRAQVEAQVEAQVWDQVRAQVWAQVEAQVEARVEAQVRAQVWAQVRAQVGRSLWGQHDAGWLGWTDAFGRLGLDVSAAEGLREVARSSGWWWAFRDLAILTERPLALHRDAEHRLHCETGPAIVWPDGWGVHAWHGVCVPAEIIEHSETITPESIATEANAEIRRVMIDRFGRERLLDSAQQIGRDDFGTLWVRHFGRDREPWVVVEVINGTPEPDGERRRFLLGVPPAFAGRGQTCEVELAGRRTRVPRTPLGAVAWTYSLSPEEYWAEGSRRT